MFFSVGVDYFDILQQICGDHPLLVRQGVNEMRLLAQNHVEAVTFELLILKVVSQLLFNFV